MFSVPLDLLDLILRSARWTASRRMRLASGPHPSRRRLRRLLRMRNSAAA
jgi:hypothetical protein